MAKLGYRKLTKAKVRKAIPESGGILSIIAKKCDVDRATLSNFVDEHEELKALVVAEREVIIDLAESSLISQVKGQQPWATKFMLATIGKQRGYVERQEIIQKQDMPSVIEEIYQKRKTQWAEKKDEPTPKDG